MIHSTFDEKIQELTSDTDTSIEFEWDNLFETGLEQLGSIILNDQTMISLTSMFPPHVKPVVPTAYKPKYRCIICYDDFPNIENLNSHMQSEIHKARADTLYILPEVGSSLEYIGPIRQRPKLLYPQQEYELCRKYARVNRCPFGTGCKLAHSEEELKVWKNAAVRTLLNRNLPEN